MRPIRPRSPRALRSVTLAWIGVTCLGAAALTACANDPRGPLVTADGALNVAVVVPAPPYSPLLAETRVFDGVAEAWQTAPETLLSATSADVTVVAPTSDTAATLLEGFVPQILVGLSGYDADSASLTVTLAQDRNANLLPDAETELSLSSTVNAEGWAATAASYPIAVYGTDGEKVADLPILGPELSLRPGSALPGGADTADLAGEVASETLIDIVVAVAGIDRDGVGELIKGVWELPSDEPLPARLPFHLRFALHAEAPQE